MFSLLNQVHLIVSNQSVFGSLSSLHCLFVSGVLTDAIEQGATRVEHVNIEEVRDNEVTVSSTAHVPAVCLYNCFIATYIIDQVFGMFP